MMMTAPRSGEQNLHWIIHALLAGYSQHLFRIRPPAGLVSIFGPQAIRFHFNKALFPQ
jgi:hypothetical protein